MSTFYLVAHNYPFHITEEIEYRDYHDTIYRIHSKARSVQLFRLIGYMDRIKRTTINIYKNGKVDHEISLEDCRKELKEIYEEHPEYLI